MTASSKDFDAAAHKFTEWVRIASYWKDNYYGAAYSTRLKQAIDEARHACDNMEKFLKENGEW
jgi:hypothetical protein